MIVISSIKKQVGNPYWGNNHKASVTSKQIRADLLSLFSFRANPYHLFGPFLPLFFSFPLTSGCMSEPGQGLGYTESLEQKILYEKDEKGPRGSHAMNDNTLLKHKALIK